jgi:hypothetical protein
MQYTNKQASYYEYLWEKQTTVLTEIWSQRWTQAIYLIPFSPFSGQFAHSARSVFVTSAFCSRQTIVPLPPPSHLCNRHWLLPMSSFNRYCTCNSCQPATTCQTSRPGCYVWSDSGKWRFSDIRKKYTAHEGERELFVWGTFILNEIWAQVKYVFWQTLCLVDILYLSLSTGTGSKL